MISRKSALLISQIYFDVFTYPAYRLQAGGYQLGFKTEELHDFFYERDYEQWFLDWLKQFGQYGQIKFRDFVKGLQTGITVLGAPVKNNTEERQAVGIGILERLAGDIIREFENRNERYNIWGDNSETRQLVNKLKSQLELDGYVYRDGKLFSVEGAVIDTREEQGYLEQLVDLLKLSDPTTIKHHIQLAGEHYVSGRYSDSISNSRHFLEAILGQILERVSIKLSRNLNPTVYKNATDTRDHLEREGLISTGEKDTLKQIYGLLSNTGGHAYIAQKDQARLMWHLALTCSQFVLLRYEGFLRAHP